MCTRIINKFEHWLSAVYLAKEDVLGVGLRTRGPEVAPEGRGQFVRHVQPPPVHPLVIDSGLAGSTHFHGVPREQKMLKGHLPRVIYHQVN